MNREIKFRAWDKVDGMTTCFSIHSSGLIAYINSEWLQDTDKPILMQFTGLKDKHGKEIYEGDVCQYFKEEPLLVEWKESETKFTLTKLTGYKGELRFDCDIEIIGNIHQNPDLLNPTTEKEG